LRNNFTGTVGGSFKLASALPQVTALGFYDFTVAGGAGGALNGSHAVGLWDSVGNLLGQVTVSSTDPLVNGFRFHNLTTPVTLAVGSTYFLGAFVNQNGDEFKDQDNTGTPPLSPRILTSIPFRLPSTLMPEA
jgi:Domain of unknown function (DUF4082)